MKTLITFVIGIALYSAAVGAASLKELKQRAHMIAGAGATAAGFAEIGKGDVDLAEVERRFTKYGDRAVKAARAWARDEELLDAPPAFRRFLYFEYLTKGTDIMAGASNPDSLLINRDSAVTSIFDNPDIASAARHNMESGTEATRFDAVGDYLLATFPMVPASEKASSCIACHASKEVNRPYPEGARVLGYTFVVQPL